MPSLPPEILCIVFEALVRIAPIAHPSSAELHKSGWLVVTHVCRRWRDIAIRSKGLWSHISVANPELFRLFVERSNAHPLSIRAGSDTGGYVSGEHVQLIFRHLSRVKALNCTARTGARAFMQVIIELNQAPKIPSLEILTLSWGFNSYVGSLSSRFFEHSPDICNVMLRNVPFPWGISHSNIRFLHLRSGMRLPTPPKDVLEGLRGLPQIEYLALEDVLQEDAPDPAVPAVVLPHLRSLRLIPVFASIVFLNSIKTHPQAYIYMGSWQVLDTDPWSHATFIECVRGHFARDRVPTAVSVNVGAPEGAPRDGRSFKIEAAFRANGPETTIHLPSHIFPVYPCFVMDIPFRNVAAIENPQAELPLQLLSSSLFTSSWTSLSLHCSVPRYPDRLWDVFCSAVNLQDIIFSGVHKTVLSKLLRDLRPDVAGSLLFPRLGTIAFEKTAFDCPHGDDKEPALLSVATEFVLRERDHLGRPMKQLFLRDCTGIIESVHVQRWNTSFGCTVHWDGKGRADTLHNHQED